MKNNFIAIITLFLSLISPALRGEEDCYSESVYCDASCQKPYLSLFGGSDVATIVFDNHSRAYLPKPMGGAALGYKFNNFRFEGEFSYRRTLLPFESALPFESFERSQHLFAAMANSYVDFFVCNWTFYLGIGLGYCKNHLKYRPKMDYFNYKSFKIDSFGWQMMCGVNYRITEQTDLGIKSIVLEETKGKIYHSNFVLNLTRYF